MEVALRALRQGNVDMGILQETKLTDGIHARQGEGYSVWVTEAESRQRGEYWYSGSRTRVAGGGNFQLRPKSGKLLADLGVSEMVRRREIRPPT